MITRATLSTIEQGLPKYRSMLAGNTAYSPTVPTVYESIATVTLSSLTTTITFNSIPSTYRHLQLRCITRTAATPSDRDSFYLQFNGDTAANYAFHGVGGDGSAVQISSSGSTSIILVGEQSANGHTANIFSPFIIDILDYANTNKFKTTRHIGGFDSNGQGNEKGKISIFSGLWRSTSAVSSISVFAGGGRQTVANSTFALYGIKSV